VTRFVGLTHFTLHNGSVVGRNKIPALIWGKLRRFRNL
jgi:hypothetical protein